MKPVITLLDRATIAPHIKIRRPDFEHEWVEYPLTSRNQTVARLRNSNIVITNKVILDANTIKQLPNIKLIAVAATGTNIIDMDFCHKKQIPVCNIQGYASHTVPEHTFSLILALRRQLFSYQKLVQQGAWQKSKTFCLFDFPIQDLYNTRLGIIGGGELGKRVANIGESMGMDVVFADRKNSPPSQKPGYLPFSEVIRTSDVISLHCLLNKETRKLIAKKELHAMKSSAILINTARGELIDEYDLAIALKDNTIAGAGLDVVKHEPILNDNPLLQCLSLPNFILTPHVAWTSDQAMQALADQLIENIEAFMRGEPQNLV